MSAKRQFRLGAFIQATGHHISAWRHPNTQIDAGLNFEHYNPHSAPQNVTEGNYGDENQREHQNKQIK
ncbi:MAG: hypothetical protein AN485_13760 [Anabaena sp. MDT14b]|nr:MAG: hypothetical protein AN485_13760 [Anabaena sp. MDT14b]